MSTVIIGAGFGDEGKGLITAFEVQRQKAEIVVRFNGGGQAGHTVQNGDFRHVYSNFGSGSQLGAMTEYGKEFILNPSVWVNEYDELASKCVSPCIAMPHKNTKITTVYDVALNMIAETLRGKNKHGSCGLGINETVTRNLKGYELTWWHLQNMSRIELVKTLLDIKNIYCQQRFDDLLKLSKVDSVSNIRHLIQLLETNPEFEADKLFEQFIKINRRVLYASPTKKRVYEGAQGLMLDEFLGEFPYVTRSMTGLPNALVHAYDNGITEVQPVYVTRCYKTRHGAGPMNNEDFPDGLNFVDNTNAPNQWQDSIRVGKFDSYEFTSIVLKDFWRGKSIAQALGITIKQPQIALTCLDQFENGIIDTTVGKLTVGELISGLEFQTGFKVAYKSFGPDIGDVEYVS